MGPGVSPAWGARWGRMKAHAETPGGKGPPQPQHTFLRQVNCAKAHVPAHVSVNTRTHVYTCAHVCACTYAHIRAQCHMCARTNTCTPAHAH